MPDSRVQDRGGWVESSQPLDDRRCEPVGALGRRPGSAKSACSARRSTSGCANCRLSGRRSSTWSSTVRPEKADVSSGSQSHRGKSQSPVTWMAGWRETETLKPIDEAIDRMVSESPGRNGSERTGGPERPELRRPSLTVERRRRHGSSHLADAVAHSGGVRAAAR